MKRIISTILICAFLTGAVGCSDKTSTDIKVSETAEEQTSETAATQEESTKESSPAVSSTSSAETEAAPESDFKAPKIKDNKYNLDGVYNTTFENNISDDVYFDVRIEYTDDNGNVVSEIISLADDLSYDDVANKLNSFGLLTTGETRDWSITKTSESRDTDGKLRYADGEHEFEYYGIAHNISIAPDAKTSVYLELVDESGLITDTAAITAKSSVKAIGSFVNHYDFGQRIEGHEDDYYNYISRLPVKIFVRAYLTDEYINNLSRREKNMLKDGNILEMSVGTYSINISKVFFGSQYALHHYSVLKNNNYTVVMFTEEGNGKYFGDIILIKK